MLEMRCGDRTDAVPSGARLPASPPPTTRRSRWGDWPRGPCPSWRVGDPRPWAPRSGCRWPSCGAACCAPAPAATGLAGRCGWTRCRRRTWRRARAARVPTPGRSAPWPTRSRRWSWPCATTLPSRVNLLVPTIDLAHLFGGYIAKFNLARRLAERGHRVRIVTVDPVGPAPARLGAPAGVLRRPRGICWTGRGGLRARVAGRRGQPRRPLHRHDLVERPRRGGRPALRGRRLVHLPDPGVRAVHVRDGHVGGAGGGLVRAAPHRAVLQRAAARLLPQPRIGVFRRRPRPATPPRCRSRTRSRRSIRRPRRS